MALKTWKVNSDEEMLIAGELIESDGNVRFHSNGDVTAPEFIEGVEFEIGSDNKVTAKEFVEEATI